MTDFLRTLNERVVVYDGAMGTNIQFRNPTRTTSGARRAATNCWCSAVRTSFATFTPAFLAVGCDVVETDTFGATRMVLAEYGLEDRVAEINCAAVKAGA